MANTYKALSTVTVGAGGASTISFSNIPQTYTDLLVKLSVRTTFAGVADDVLLTLNGLSSGYSNKILYGNGSNAFSTSAYGNLVTSPPAANATANTFGNVEFYIPNYALTNSKVYSSDSVSENNATESYTHLIAGRNTTTNPITSISLAGVGNFVQYSTATLYGVFNADVSSAPATPTIGTASVASGTSASITFTGVSNAASYTMTSTPSSITGTGTTSPITVSGLTTGTAYTFKVKSNNPFGSSAESAASNSVTPIVYGFESIATTTVGAGGASYIEFTSIPSTYTHLQIRWVARSSFASSGNIISLFARFNSDTGANYARHVLYGDGASIGVGGGGGTTSMGISYVPAANYATGMFGSGVIDILDYANSNKFKTIRSLGGCDTNGTGTEKGIQALYSGVWQSTSAVSTIRIACDSGLSTGLTQYSTFALYGIKVA